jgi:hypoxanthine phosphoribosyltransferase
MISVHELTFIPLIAETVIQQRVETLAMQLTERYEGKNPLFLVLLNGAFIFAADLVRACPMQGEIVFVKLSSYEGMQSSGKVITVIGVEEQVVKGREVIIVEDIVDSGKTMHDFLQTIRGYSPTCFHRHVTAQTKCLAIRCANRLRGICYRR